MERRSTRQRKVINYADLISLPKEDDESAAQLAEFEAQDSGSDFAPVTRPEQAEPDSDSNDEPEVDEEASNTDNTDPDGALDPIAFPVSKKSRPTSKSRSKNANTTLGSTLDVIKPVFGGASLLRSSKRQTYALPIQSAQHRHRALSLFSIPNDVERLTKKPFLFHPCSTIRTNNFTQNQNVSERVGKAWGYNVGPGPMWELLEDRAWYKEAQPPIDSGFQTESTARPLVFENILLRSDYELLNHQDAVPYLPKGAVDAEGSSGPPIVPCSYGPINHQTRVELEMFQSLSLSEYFPEKTSHVFNPGAPVWGLDWCPIHTTDRENRAHKQYLAVGPLSSSAHSPEVGVRVARPSPASIQIWSFSSRETELDNSDMEPQPPNACSMTCEMVLCIDSGPALELKWCPLPSHDMTTNRKSNLPRKLGLLSGTFEDGTFCIYVIPDPQDMTPVGQDGSCPTYVRIAEPLVRIQLGETNCFAIDWANSEVVAIGTTHGTLAVYNFGELFKSLTAEDCLIVHDNLLPTHYLTLHQSAIRTVAWIRVPPCGSDGSSEFDWDPTVVCSGGYDGMACITDIREGHGSVINRTRDTINTMTFSYFGGGIITVDHENVVKSYSASPSMLGRGHLLLEPQGPIWSLHASDYHPQLAVGSADGACYTTNVLRSARRSSAVPFFVYRIYQMDYSRKTGEYRMLDRFLPQETAEKQKGTLKSERGTEVVSTGTWPQQVGVQRVVWNACNGFANAALLASSTGSGLCRIDNLWGRFWKDRVPYNGIEHIRMEAEALDNAMEVDSQDESGEEL